MKNSAEGTEASEYRAGGEEKEAWEEDWDDERMANGWYEGAALGSAVDLAQGSDAVSGGLGEEIPARQEMGHALVIVPDPRGEKETRKTIKLGMFVQKKHKEPGKGPKDL